MAGEPERIFSMTKAFILASLILVDAVIACERHCLGPGDLSADHSVDAQDYALLAGCLAGPGATPSSDCPPEITLSADPDQDGNIDLLDVAQFALSFNKTYFDYEPSREDDDAEKMAIYTSGSLRALDSDYERFHRDLESIRTKFPETVDVHLSNTGWRANGTVVSLVDEDERDGFDELNSYYGIVSEEGRSYGHVLTFCDQINPFTLSSIYRQLEEVEWADADLSVCTILCCGNNIDVEVDGTIVRYYFFIQYPPKEPTDDCSWDYRIFETTEDGVVTEIPWP